MNLDELKIGTFTDEFVKKLSKIDHLGDLTMNNCKITSLAGFPTSLPLVRLELNDNHFEGSDLKYLSQLSVLV